MIQKRKENGFTLIEMLLAAAISLIGFSAITAILMLVYKNSHLLETVDQVQQQTNIALEKVVKEFQETAVGNMDPDPSSINSEANSSDIISFPSARDDNGNFLLDGNGKPDWTNAIVYFRDAGSNALYRYRDAKDDWSTNYAVSGFNRQVAGRELMATAVTDVEFWFSGNNLLNIKMTIALNSEAANPTEEEFITAVVIRN
jgi:prepilin-type N-terminal cleavage/methylation domain-containing protein